MGSRYQQVYDGEWFPVPKQLDMQCCDCSLIHAVYFRINAKGKRVDLEMRMDRNNRATAAARRHKKGRRARS